MRERPFRHRAAPVRASWSPILTHERGLRQQTELRPGSADEAVFWLPVPPACQAGRVSNPESSAICTARGCQAAAAWAVVWNNPRLHAPDREKVWAACDEHRQSLADYLAVRSFLRRVEPLEAGH